MSEPWTEDEVRATWMATQRESLDKWRHKVRAAGWPPDLIEQMAEATMAQSDENLEHSLPMILRDLAITGGFASSH